MDWRLGALHETHWPNALGQFSVSEIRFPGQMNLRKVPAGAASPAYARKTEESEAWNAF